MEAAEIHPAKGVGIADIPNYIALNDSVVHLAIQVDACRRTVNKLVIAHNRGIVDEGIVPPHPNPVEVGFELTVLNICRTCGRAAVQPMIDPKVRGPELQITHRDLASVHIQAAVVQTTIDHRTPFRDGILLTTNKQP